MNPTDFALRKTGDGSETLYSSEMQESYHSLNGAVQESKHVFIDAGLKQCLHKNIAIFEIGFGTGLNALLTWGHAKRFHLDVTYTAVEKFPLPIQTIASLGYDSLEPALSQESFKMLHESVWGQPIILEKKCFSLTKLQEDFTSMSFQEKFDVIFYDAFAPEKQPEMWEEYLFTRLFEALHENGLLVTYCAKGEVRRRLQRSGFKVDRIPGPPGKREMLRAVKSSF